MTCLGRPGSDRPEGLASEIHRPEGILRGRSRCLVSRVVLVAGRRRRGRLRSRQGFAILGLHVFQTLFQLLDALRHLFPGWSLRRPGSGRAVRVGGGSTITGVGQTPGGRIARPRTWGASIGRRSPKSRAGGHPIPRTEGRPIAWAPRRRSIGCAVARWRRWWQIVLRTVSVIAFTKPFSRIHHVHGAESVPMSRRLGQQGTYPHRHGCRISICLIQCNSP